MSVKGKRAKANKTEASKFNVNDNVVAAIDGENVTGRVIRLKGKQAMVKLDNEDADVCPIDLDALCFVCEGSDCTNPVDERGGMCEYCTTEAERRSDPDFEDEDDEDDDFEEDRTKRGGTKTDQIGFNQYGIKWNPEKTNFNIPQTNGVAFYGWVRKTRTADLALAYAVDVFVKTDSEYTMDSIFYTANDPRENMRSLNADICAACNKWMFQNMRSDGAVSIDVLRKKAEHPTVMIRRIETIDKLILKLREHRDTAIRCGGTRNIEIVGDVSGAPVLLTIDVTSQAIALDGKPPSLSMGAMIDSVVIDKQNPKKKGEAPTRVIPTANVPDSSNVRELVARLEATKDESERRKLRGILRKMGHRGGARKAPKD